MEQAIAAAAAVIRQARHLLISAGAGMGVDSGLPDFRGDEGFWKAYPAYRKQGRSFVSMANPRSFAESPAAGWGFYGHRLQLYRETVPHAGFGLLRRWAQQKRSHFVFTSNVDGQFQRAGFAPDRLLEIHGSIHHLQCCTPCCDDVYPAEGIEVAVDLERMEALPPLPRCPRCQDLARPNILMFGDYGFISARIEEQHQRYQAWLDGLVGEPLAIVELGAGTAVPTVRYESEQRVISGKGQVTLIRINPREPQVPRGQLALAQGALAALQAIDAAL